MKIQHNTRSDVDALAEVFITSFTASEGAAEGALIGELVRKLLGTVPSADIVALSAVDQKGILGAVIYTRILLSEPRRAALLSPLAVMPEAQKKGVGKALIAAGKETLRAAGYDILITYGDPAYYGQSGFEPISQADVKPPYPLSYAYGWQALSLTEAPLRPIQATAEFVVPFSDPAFW